MANPLQLNATNCYKNSIYRQKHCKGQSRQLKNKFFDKKVHSFNIDDLVWFEDFAPLWKNPKLTPKWSGPAKVTEINDTNARILIPNSKAKVLNVMCLNKFSLTKMFLKMTVTVKKLLQKIWILTQSLKFLAP